MPPCFDFNFINYTHLYFNKRKDRGRDKAYKWKSSLENGNEANNLSSREQMQATEIGDKVARLADKY